MNERITREQMLLEMAYAASRRGTCERLHVGAIISKDGHPVAGGYVGAPSGEPHCSPDICDMTKPCLRTVHAERNAIIYAHRITRLDYLDGFDLTCTDSPCLACAQLIAGSGIKRVFYHREYRVKDGIDYLRSKGVVVTHVERALPEIAHQPVVEIHAQKS